MYTYIPVCSAIVSHELTSSHHYVLANHILKGLHDQILWKNTETFSAIIIKKEKFYKFDTDNYSIKLIHPTLMLYFYNPDNNF